MRQKLLSGLFAVAIAVALFSFRTAPADFSGTWSLNEGKSELGQFGTRVADSKIVIEQKDNVLTVSRTRASMEGDNITTNETLAEGKESEVTIGPMKKKSVLKWAADGQSFTLDYTLAGDFGNGPFEWKGKETWTIGSDGKSFTLGGTLNTPQGDFSTKAMYEKK